jgi:hypothetical protein
MDSNAAGRAGQLHAIANEFKSLGLQFGIAAECNSRSEVCNGDQDFEGRLDGERRAGERIELPTVSY